MDIGKFVKNVAIVTSVFVLAVPSLVYGVVTGGPCHFEYQKHTVKKGETLFGIAKQYCMKPSEILRINQSNLKGRNPDKIYYDRDKFNVVDKCRRGYSGISISPSGRGAHEASQ